MRACVCVLVGQSAVELLRAHPVLAAARADLSNVVDLTVFLTDMSHYGAMNAVYNQYFNAESGPTRTCVAVRELPNPNLLIEIKAVAVDVRPGIG